jgi:hypothetical protein
MEVNSTQSSFLLSQPSQVGDSYQRHADIYRYNGKLWWMVGGLLIDPVHFNKHGVNWYICQTFHFKHGQYWQPSHITTKLDGLPVPPMEHKTLMIEQVAPIKSNLLLDNILQNSLVLQLFTMIFARESI